LLVRSDPADRAGVAGDLAVSGEQGDAFDGGLCDQDAVEGIFVGAGEEAGAGGMKGADGEGLEGFAEDGFEIEGEFLS